MDPKPTPMARSSSNWVKIKDLEGGSALRYDVPRELNFSQHIVIEGRSFNNPMGCRSYKRAKLGGEFQRSDGQDEQWGLGRIWYVGLWTASRSPYPLVNITNAAANAEKEGSAGFWAYSTWCPLEAS